MQAGSAGRAPCEVCSEPCPERGNGQVNLCGECAYRMLVELHVRRVALVERESNGSQTARRPADALRELGARVVVVLGTAGLDAAGKVSAIRRATDALGFSGSAGVRL